MDIQDVDLFFDCVLRGGVGVKVQTNSISCGASFRGGLECVHAQKVGCGFSANLLDMARQPT